MRCEIAHPVLQRLLGTLTIVNVEDRDYDTFVVGDDRLLLNSKP